MNAIKIDDIKTFMNKLLLKDDFDSFLLEEASITTYNTFTIDGHIMKAFYTNEEFDELESNTLSYWKAIKPICFELIKGKKLPIKFKLVFKLDNKGISKLLSESNLPFNEDEIAGLYFNIKYENNSLACITATSTTTFTLDKSLEKLWDEWMEKYINQL